ncbi:MAG: hypothetical protein KIH69_004950 [Anaerolineae bacterium]|nr:hypothetical protein [Anaerolineae bacterium]
MALPQILIFDASVLFNLGHRDHLAWLIERLGQSHRLLVPNAVLQEIARERMFDYAAFCERYFEVYLANFDALSAEHLAELNQTLDFGEIAVIAGAIELTGAVILDERHARNLAKQRGLFVIGTLGLLAHAVEQGWCDDNTAFATVRELIHNRFSLPSPKTSASFVEYMRLLQASQK